ncbi:metallophosphoesterase family protein [Rhodococcoides yunnanense]|jgi:exonuclease SbcD|uniref:metallophosphoesterase family protein n=1 Tax=Rhodococcoides yunnanense TaxID=278209 RepID=UPI0022B1D332|nr:exonuclease SbcCD subunit D [Rhodococcus yunnanensis]MCZ4278613.1 exonuclease SbcCD subunit D [Rhodococcus yunnanensis]
MRILHTSDWHIGRTFHGVDLLADQAAALTAIADLVAAQRIDVVVVPGDIYDRAVPSADAVLVCNRGLEAIRSAGAVIVATAGNHDSPARLGAGAAFASAGGLHLMTRVADVGSPVVVDDEFGSVAFYGIPYLEPETTRIELGIPSARTHEEVLTAAMDRVTTDLGERRAAGGRVRSVVLAHAFVVGGEATGSERSISVGGVETAPAAAFDGADYVALGHLHSPQTLTERVRYSGSPLPYSFGERSHRKAVWVVELNADGLHSVERVDLPVVRGLSRIEGTVDELLHEESFDEAETHYVSAVLTDAVRPVDAMRSLRTRFPHAVHLEWNSPSNESGLRYRDRVRGRSDSEIMASFVTDMRSVPTPSETLLLERALAAVQRDDVAADIAGTPETGAPDDLLGRTA